MADAGQNTADGAGHSTAADVVSFGGVITPRTLSGTYQTNADSSGTSTFTDSLGDSAHFRNTVSPDGLHITSIETDAGTIITNVATYQFAQSSAAIVNGTSFAANAAAPGALISIFGDNLASGVAEATATPWPMQLGTTKVLVNGTAIPLYYLNPNQIDAQLPVNLAPGPAQLVVSVGGASSAPVTFTVSAAAPGIFTYGGFLRAIAVDYTGSRLGAVIGPATPAQPGDVLSVYLTGGGAVQPTGGTWTTGAVSPPGLSQVTGQYSVTIGGLPRWTAVAEHDGRLVRFHPRFLAFDREYNFVPRACNPASGCRGGKWSVAASDTCAKTSGPCASSPICTM